jgi:hypothetical protein
MQTTKQSDPKSQFAVIRSLVRAALVQRNDAVVQQVKRLADSYISLGQPAEAKELRDLLEEQGGDPSFAPSRLVRSRATPIGEELTPRTGPPVDRETSVPLAELLFADSCPAGPPIFNADVEAGLRSLLEEWAHSKALHDAGVTAARSCLIYGAPGTGKTRLALWMAGQLGLPIVLARLDGLVSSFLGTTSRNIGALFQFANRYRCVLLLDEFDAIAKMRDDPHEVGEIKRVVNTLLQNIDGRREIGLTIGVTNHEQLLDPAIWRRFDVQFAVPSPDFPARVAIARHYMARHPLPDEQLRILAWLSDGLSGAEIEALCRSIRKTAAIAKEDFDFLSSIRSLAMLHAGRVPKLRQEQLREENNVLARTWLADKSLALGQRDIASIFRRDPGTISRWLRERGATSRASP